MSNVIYAFGEFRLNPLARELKRNDKFISLPASAFDCLVYLVEHRERPVGRDELISAVWGRLDVSDSLLAQTVVRLRRELGDDGNEQHTIRTIARIGYRWMVETTDLSKSLNAIAPTGLVEETSVVQNDVRVDTAFAEISHHSLIKRFHHRKIRIAATIALSASIAVVAAALLMPLRHRTYEKSGLTGGSGLVAVLPAEVNAPEEWRWLKLGMMAIVSDRLTQGQMRTMPSQVVIRQLNVKSTDNARDAFSDSKEGVSTRIQPYVSLSGGKWVVRLEIYTSSNDMVKVQAVADDALTAGDLSADLLLVRSGHTPPTNADSPVGQQLLVQRIKAARLSGQKDLAQRLIDRSPDAIKSLPIIRFYTALLRMDYGEFAMAESLLRALLAQIPVRPDTAVLRGRILESLGACAQHNDEKDKAIKFYDEAIPLLQGKGNETYLGYAYANRAQMKDSLLLFDQASDDVGRARTIYGRTGDLQGAAVADYETALILRDRGQLDASTSLLKKSYQEFLFIGDDGALATVLTATSDNQRLSLHYAEALRTTDEFWPIRSSGNDRLGRFWLTLSRAQALADVGRSKDAKILANSIFKESSFSDAPYLYASTQTLLASIAMDCGSYKEAVEAAGLARSPALKKASEVSYARTWSILIQALARNGQAKEAGIETGKMRQWVAAKTPDEWSEIYAGLAEAEQSGAEHHMEKSLQQFAIIMGLAQKLGVPELLVAVGHEYASAALKAGDIDKATAVSGTLSPFAASDMRAAETEARVYNALGQRDASLRAYKIATALARERHMQSMDLAGN